jgi:hypothetical protein
MGRAKRQRLGADVWRGLLAKFAGSDLSVRAFCSQEGISPSSFNWWRSRLNGRGRRQQSVSPSSAVGAGEFVDLGTLSAATASPSGRFELRLDLGGGLTLHLVRG